jgi:hypothetical protein
MPDRRRVICVLKRHYGSHRREIFVRPDAFQSCDGRPNASSARRSHCRPVRALLVDGSRCRPWRIDGRQTESPLCNLRHFRRKTANQGAHLPLPTAPSDEGAGDFTAPSGRPDGLLTLVRPIDREATRSCLGISSDQPARPQPGGRDCKRGTQTSGQQGPRGRVYSAPASLLFGTSDISVGDGGS